MVFGKLIRQDRYEILLRRPCFRNVGQHYR